MKKLLIFCFLVIPFLAFSQAGKDSAVYQYNGTPFEFNKIKARNGFQLVERDTIYGADSGTFRYFHGQVWLKQKYWQPFAITGGPGLPLTTKGSVISFDNSPYEVIAPITSGIKTVLTWESDGLTQGLATHDTALQSITYNRQPGDIAVYNADGNLTNIKPTQSDCENVTNIQLSYRSALTFDYPAVPYRLHCVTYNLVGGSFDIAPGDADPGEFRYDMVYVDNTDPTVLHVKKGTNSTGGIAALPELDDDATQGFVTYIRVDESGTEPTGITARVLYFNHSPSGEFIFQTFGGITANPGYATNPLAPADSSIRVTTAPNNSGINLNSPSGILSASGEGKMTMWIRNNGVLAANRNIVLRKYNGTAIAAGSQAITLGTANGYFKTVHDYILVSINLADFQGADAFTSIQIRFTGTGATPDIQFANIRFEHGITIGEAPKQPAISVITDAAGTSYVAPGPGATLNIAAGSAIQSYIIGNTLHNDLGGTMAASTTINGNNQSFQESGYSLRSISSDGQLILQSNLTNGLIINVDGSQLAQFGTVPIGSKLTLRTSGGVTTWTSPTAGLENLGQTLITAGNTGLFTQPVIRGNVMYWAGNSWANFSFAGTPTLGTLLKNYYGMSVDSTLAITGGNSITLAKNIYANVNGAKTDHDMFWWTQYVDIVGLKPYTQPATGGTNGYNPDSLYGVNKPYKAYFKIYDNTKAALAMCYIDSIIDLSALSHSGFTTLNPVTDSTYGKSSSTLKGQGSVVFHKPAGVRNIVVGFNVSDSARILTGKLALLNSNGDTLYKINTAGRNNSDGVSGLKRGLSYDVAILREISSAADDFTIVCYGGIDCYIDYAGWMVDPKLSNKSIYVLNEVYKYADPWPSSFYQWPSSPSITDSVNAALGKAVREFYGYKVFIVNAREVFTPADNNNGGHPTASGAAHVANLIEKNIQRVLYQPSYDSSSSGGDGGGGGTYPGDSPDRINGPATADVNTDMRGHAMAIFSDNGTTVGVFGVGPDAGATFIGNNSSDGLSGGYLEFGSSVHVALSGTTPFVGGATDSVNYVGTSFVQKDWVTAQIAAVAGVPTSRTISTTSPLAGGGDLSANRTLSIANAAADGSTKGAASFTANDFDASSGNISIDYTNGQAAATGAKGFLTSTDWNTFNNKLSSVGIGTSITSATAGSIFYAGTGGVLRQSNTGLFYDSTNIRLGIGTGAPTHTVTLNSTSTGIAIHNQTDQTTNYERFRMYWSGNTAEVLTENGGTGTARNLALGAGGSNRIVLQATANSTIGAVNMATAQSGAAAVALGLTGTFTNSSGFINGIAIINTITETSTGGNRGLWISNFYSTVGSGAHWLIDAGTNSAGSGSGTHTQMWAVDNKGHEFFSTTTTTTGTTGNQTINKPTGTVNIAAAGTTVTVTNSLVSATSIVYAVIRTNDATAKIKNVVPGSGSFVITLDAAATSEISIGFIVFN